MTTGTIIGRGAFTLVDGRCGTPTPGGANRVPISCFISFERLH
jgi:hypothetical protein